MNFFQLFIPILIVLALVIISRGRIVIVERLFYIVITIIGLYFIFFPNNTSRIANFLGIGRGADLIFYLFILFSWFWFASISTKMRRNDRKITHLVRTIAINHPLRVPDSAKKPKSKLVS